MLVLVVLNIINLKFKAYLKSYLKIHNASFRPVNFVLTICRCRNHKKDNDF